MRTPRVMLTLSTALLFAVGAASTAGGANLIGHWDFEEGGGSTALDSSGNALHGAISNATYTEGIIGLYALDFNGSSAFVEVANDPLLTPQTIGISLWFKARAAQQAQPDLLDKGHGQGSSPYFAGYVLQYQHADPTIVEAFYGNGSNFYSLGTGPGYLDDTWHHLVANLGEDEIALWVDAELIDRIAGMGPLVQNNSNLYFGRHRALGRYFNGLLDDIQLYDGPLSQDDVDAIFPEPATLSLLALCGLSLLVGRRRARPAK